MPISYNTVYEYIELRCTLREDGAHIQGHKCTDVSLGSHRLAGKLYMMYKNG